jgi:hypothetical protein
VAALMQLYADGNLPRWLTTRSPARLDLVRNGERYWGRLSITEGTFDHA